MSDRQDKIREQAVRLIAAYGLDGAIFVVDGLIDRPGLHDSEYYSELRQFLVVQKSRRQPPRRYRGAFQSEIE